MADPHARAWYATQASQEDIEALVDERDALEADLSSVRAQLEQTREAIRAAEAFIDRRHTGPGTENGEPSADCEACTMIGKLRAALAAADPAPDPVRPNEHTATNLPATATVFPRPPAERKDSERPNGRGNDERT